MEHPEVLIIGGGVVGCAIGYDLARKGVSVEIVERGALAQEASWASAGIISAPSPRLPARVPLEILAYERYPRLIAEIEEVSGISTGWNLTGEVVAGTPVDEAELQRTMSWQIDNEVNVSWLDQEALRACEPAIGAHFTAGVLLPGVASVRLSQVTVALARAAQRHGARVSEFVDVHSIETQAARAIGVRSTLGRKSAGVVVIAAGAWSRALGETIDLSIPTVPVRGQMLAIDSPPIRIRSIIAAEGAYIVPRIDGTVAVGATEEHHSGFDKAVTPKGISWLVDRVGRMAPSLNSGRLINTWAGLRPGTEDGELIIGQAPHLDNIWIATGHFRTGATLAPATSELLSSSIISGEVDGRLKPFDPARFQ